MGATAREAGLFLAEISVQELDGVGKVAVGRPWATVPAAHLNGWHLAWGPPSGGGSRHPGGGWPRRPLLQPQGDDRDPPGDAVDPRG